MTELLKKSQIVKEALRLAVLEALQKKRCLDQYAVIYKDGRTVRLEPSELPAKSDTSCNS